MDSLLKVSETESRIDGAHATKVLWLAEGRFGSCHFLVFYGKVLHILTDSSVVLQHERTIDFIVGYTLIEVWAGWSRRCVAGSGEESPDTTGQDGR